MGKPANVHAWLPQFHNGAFAPNETDFSTTYKEYYDERESTNIL
jgi:hypothetical protein